MQEAGLVNMAVAHLFSTTMALAHFMAALCCSALERKLSITSLEAPLPPADLHIYITFKIQPQVSTASVVDCNCAQQVVNYLCLRVAMIASGQLHHRLTGCHAKMSPGGHCAPAASLPRHQCPAEGHPGCHSGADTPPLTAMGMLGDTPLAEGMRLFCTHCVWHSGLHHAMPSD